MDEAPKQTSATRSRVQDATPLVLLVEDEPEVREVIRQVLELAGFCVLECNGPRQALKLADEHRDVQLLLSDVVMPEMSGVDLARLLQKQHPGLVTVFMSGYSAPEAMHKELGDSNGFHLQKPFTMDLLLARVAEAMQKGAAQEARV